MENPGLSFRAQRLDNQDPDHMEIDQYSLSEEDVAERLNLARKISEVSLKGSQAFSEGYHTAFLRYNKKLLWFLLKTPSDQLDNAGRIAPIITYGRVPDEPSESWPGDVVEALNAFAERIGRTVSKKNAKVARCAMEAVLKKKRRDSIRRKALLATVFAIVLMVIYWIVFKND